MTEIRLPDGIHPASRKSTSKVIRTIDGGFTIELLRVLGADDVPALLSIAQTLVESFNLKLLATRKDIMKYFNYPETFPIVAKHAGTPVGFIIGAELEKFEGEGWVEMDETFGNEETIYTYAYAVKESHKGKGIGSELKKTFIWWCRERGYKFVSGHVREGVSAGMGGEPQVLSRMENWNGTGLVFEYYRRAL